MCCIITALMRKAICAAAIVVTVCELLLTVAFHFPFAWVVDESAVKGFGGMWLFCYIQKQSNGVDIDTNQKCDSITSSNSGDIGHSYGNYATSRSFVIIAELLLVANIVILYVACICFASKVVAIISLAVALAQAILITIVQPMQASMFDEVELFGQTYQTKTFITGYILWVAMIGSWIVAGLSVVVLLFIIWETSD